MFILNILMFFFKYKIYKKVRQVDTDTALLNSRLGYDRLILNSMIPIIGIIE